VLDPTSLVDVEMSLYVRRRVARRRSMMMMPVQVFEHRSVMKGLASLGGDVEREGEGGEGGDGERKTERERERKLRKRKRGDEEKGAVACG
jgi:hypothetical protein